MKIGLVLLCRYNSKRLPGKILREINGRTVLGRIVDRISIGAQNYPFVVATSTDPSDDIIADYCRRAGYECFRGPLEDVSERFEQCALKYGWDFAARINGDNLFVDYDSLRAMLAIADTNVFDFVTNVPGRTFPLGMSIEIIRVQFYRDVVKNFIDKADFEHVTSWLYNNPSVGRRYVFENKVCPEAAGFQLALDTNEDFLLAQHIFDNAGSNQTKLGIKDIYKLATGGLVSSPWHGESGPLLIAEIGGNHEGDFEVAKAMAESAINSGVDCVKFQIYRGDSLVSPVESPDRHKHFKRFELEPEQHIELAKMCKRSGVQYLSSVWDMEMLEWIDPYMDIYKIGSGDLTAWPLLRQFASRGKPIILSTGLATLDEVIQAVNQIQSVDHRYKRPEWLCLLQCTSMYPIPDSDAQLGVMDTLRAATGLSVGYSDHTEGSSAIRSAVAMGAQVIEFHFTDTREGKEFRDHKVSLVAEEVRMLKNDLEKITSYIGNGIKTPQPSELINHHQISFRRGVYTKRPIKKGCLINAKDLILLRPAHGIDARDYSKLECSRALRDINPFEALLEGKDFSTSN
jgi:N-acetylneuraminate synthase/N,N'-diacetyllegionaminate synthase